MGVDALEFHRQSIREPATDGSDHVNAVINVKEPNVWPPIIFTGIDGAEYTEDSAWYLCQSSFHDWPDGGSPYITKEQFYACKEDLDSVIKWMDNQDIPYP